MDIYGREWPNVTPAELCTTCGQPDNCGDCSHSRLSRSTVLALGGVLPIRTGEGEQVDPWQT